MIDDIYTDPDSIFALYQYGLTLFVSDVADTNSGVTSGATVTGGTGGATVPPLIEYTPVGGNWWKLDPEEVLV